MQIAPKILHAFGHLFISLLSSNSSLSHKETISHKESIHVLLTVQFLRMLQPHRLLGSRLPEKFEA